MPRVYGDTIREHIVNNVEQDVRLMTDESPLYTEIGNELGSYETVKRSIKEYVRGDVHTNTVEGFDQTSADLLKVKPPAKGAKRRTRKRPAKKRAFKTR